MELRDGVDVHAIRDRRPLCQRPCLSRQVGRQRCGEAAVVVVDERRAVAPVRCERRAQARLAVRFDRALELVQVGIRIVAVSALGREVRVHVGGDAAGHHQHRLVQRRQACLDRRQRLHQRHPRLERLVHEPELERGHALRVMVGIDETRHHQHAGAAGPLGARMGREQIVCVAQLGNDAVADQHGAALDGFGGGRRQHGRTGDQKFGGHRGQYRSGAGDTVGRLRSRTGGDRPRPLTSGR